MAEIRNTFLKSKMNKDLDGRLLPNGEYRDARNVNISRSENSDVGAIENISGNFLSKDWLNSLSVSRDCPGLEVLGYTNDLANDRIFVFLTNYTDNSIDNLSNFAPAEAIEPAPPNRTIYKGACCWIAYYNVVSQQGEIVVSGNFLNFSTTHPITADILEDLLFFTDDRNQPRKINVNNAIANPETYYTNEDVVSVTKYSPFQPPNLYYKNGSGDYVSSMLNKTEEYLPATCLSMIKENTVAGNVDVVLTDVINSYITYPPAVITRGINLMKPDLGYFNITAAGGGFDEFQMEYPIGSGANAATSVTNYIAAAKAAGYESQATAIAPAPASVGQGFTIGDVISFQLPNPDYNATWSGDKKWLEDKFVRFSYRFKYDDGEYSLMAPFTQPAFIPKQWGSFINGYNWLYGGDGEVNAGAFDQRWALWERDIWNGDEDDVGKSGIVSFMENQVNEIKINIPAPHLSSVYGTTQMPANLIEENLKVTEIDILLKRSDGIAITVVDTIPISELSAVTDKYYIYDYKSEKPIKVLPINQTTRVYDKSPIRAKTQAISGNRIIYGNYIDKQTPPSYLDYEVDILPKQNISAVAGTFSQTKLEYPNHSLKQNRTYQVGIVLSDRYGRSSSVILRDKTLPISGGTFTDTVYSDYTGGGTNTLNWPGNQLYVLFNQIIPVSISGKPDYPGIYSSTNPLGWYSYKVVVKQTEQEYYNVYLAGATSGDIVWTSEGGKQPDGTTDKISAEPVYFNNSKVSNISLYNDNINKVPKALIDVGATDTIYGSEVLLYPRVITENLLNAEYLPPQSVISPNILPISVQAPDGLFESSVTSIRPFRDLGEWTTKKGVGGSILATPPTDRWYPNNETDPPAAIWFDPFYKADDNPFIATITTNFVVGAGKSLQERYASNFFSNQLTIFETAPVKSNIDIFWESSTSGLVTDLNTAISSDINPNIVTDVSDVSFQFTEADVGGAAVTATFEPVDSTNTPCSDASGSASNLIVINGDGVTVEGFELVTVVNGGTGVGVDGFYIKSKKSRTYLYSSTNRRWTFSLNVTANGGTINKVFKGKLSNVAPSFNYNPIQWANGGIVDGSTKVKSTELNPSGTLLNLQNECIWEINPDSFNNGSLVNPNAEIYVEMTGIIYDGSGVPYPTSDWPLSARPVIYSPGTFNGGQSFMASSVKSTSWVIAWPYSIYEIISYTPGRDFQFTLKITDCNNNQPNNVGGLSTTTTASVLLPIWGKLI